MNDIDDFKYSLESAKNVQRKMLLEAIQRLVYIDVIENYRYISFGSMTFSNLKFFKENLSFQDMIVLEEDNDRRRRLEFNCPGNSHIYYDSIDITLEDLPHKKSIVWLEYAKIVDSKILKDIETVINNVEVGSLILFSVNVDNPKLELCDQEKRNPNLRKQKKLETVTEVNTLLFDRLDIDKETDPLLEKESIFKSWNFAKKCREIIDDQIHECIKSREDRECKGISYQQLFNFHYNDSCKTLTVGGIVKDDSIQEKVNECTFDDLFFVRNGEMALEISIPDLTEKEVRYLESFLPDNKEGVDREILPNMNTIKVEREYKLLKYIVQ